MKDLLLMPDAQGKTPLIDFKISGELTIEGRSIIENAVEFYQPALEWVNGLNEVCPPTIELTIRLEYFNTRSSKMILNILKSLERLHSKGTSRVMVKWKYGENDIDMQEAGHDYQSVVKLPFKITSLMEN